MTKKLKAIYIAGLLIIGALLILIFLQIGHHAASPIPEVTHSFIETGKESIVGFKIYNSKNVDQNYTFAILVDDKEIGKNIVPLRTNRTWEYAGFFPANENKSVRVTMLIWKEEELIYNKTHRLQTSTVLKNNNQEAN